MKARVKLVEGMQFVGSADSGHGVVMDAAAAVPSQALRGEIFTA